MSPGPYVLEKGRGGAEDKYGRPLKLALRFRQVIENMALQCSRRGKMKHVASTCHSDHTAVLGENESVRYSIYEYSRSES